jgi:hypothetical protein
MRLLSICFLGVVRAATVSGPIAATAPLGDASHDYPFYAALQDLKSLGYIEQEFFIEGRANRYETPAAENGKITDSDHPYKTRIVVRRPVSASRFNGTVVVEWNNVTSGHDLDIDWYQAGDYFIRSGYAWVGVTAQRIGVDALKVWNAKRYTTLDVSADGTITNDALSYDIMSDVGRLVRKPANVDILGGLKPQRVFATGHSQSAGRLAIYTNAVHPLAPVYDAVVLHGGGAKVRTDLDLKVWKLLSETDVLNQAAIRQPDTKNFRTWEVAGDSHVDTKFIASSRALGTRDGNPVAPGSNPGGRGNTATSSSGVPPACDKSPYSHVPFYQVMDAAFDHLVRWVKDGTLPPSAPPLEASSVGPPAVFARDKMGNSLGGIRLAEHAVPTGVNTGQNSGPGFCRLYGSHEDFDAAAIASLYPSHADYVGKVKRVTEENLKAGYILKVDADATIAAAEKSSVGSR